MARTTHFGVGGWCTRTVGSSGLKLKVKLGHISPAAMRLAKSYIDLRPPQSVRGAVASPARLKLRPLFRPRIDHLDDLIHACGRQLDHRLECRSTMSPHRDNRLSAPPFSLVSLMPRYKGR